MVYLRSHRTSTLYINLSEYDGESTQAANKNIVELVDKYSSMEGLKKGVSAVTDEEFAEMKTDPRFAEPFEAGQFVQIKESRARRSGSQAPNQPTPDSGPDDMGAEILDDEEAADLGIEVTG